MFDIFLVNIPINAFAGGAIPLSFAAFSGGFGISNALLPQVRKDFPETWVWENMIIDNRLVFVMFLRSEVIFPYLSSSEQ